jgi:uncharacterized phage protein gp47/JayE
MANIYGPILPLQLDSRNTEALVRAIQTRIYLESGGQLNDFTPSSPLTAISEGQAFAQAELLYYLNNLPEAFSLQWLRQLGIQRKIGSRALVDVTFYKVPGYQRVLIIPKGTKVIANGGQVFVTLEEVRILEANFSATIVCQSEKWGSVYNVPAGEINKIEKNFAGLEFLRNETSAVGGTDTESVAQMKQRAFEVLSRRNLTSAVDFENEIRTLVPEANIVKVLTYEERNGLSGSLSGNVVICVGDENGNELSASNLSYIINSIKPRVTIGTNISIVAPEIFPIDLAIEVYYDPSVITGGTDFLSSQIIEAMRSFINPQNLPLGSDLSYQNLLKVLYAFDFVDSVNTLDVKSMLKNSSVIEGFCAGFSGEETETGCNYEYVGVVNKDNEIQPSFSPISSYKLYRAQVTFTSIGDFSPLTFYYENLYTP